MKLHRLRKIATRLVFAGIAYTSLGMLCPPVPQPATCTACPTGTVGCAGICIPVLQKGAACDQDACSTNGRCADGLSCFSLITGQQATCTDLRLGLLSPCNTSSGADYCGGETYCAAPGCNNDVQRCANPAGVGQTCDGDTNKPGVTTACTPCGPGLTCVGEGGGKQGICQQKCADDTQCACVSGSTTALTCTKGQVTSPSNANTPDHCTTCGKKGDICALDAPCCGTDITCGGDGKCCTARGQTCAAAADCCTGDVCGSSGTCAACHPQNTECRSNADCCGASTGAAACDGGVCRGKCSNVVKTMPATCHTGQKGVCDQGKWECTSQDAYAPPNCIQQKFATPEICDGLDNDCNGLVDDKIASTPCDTAHPSQCQTGFLSPGKTSCVSGKPQCTASVGVNFCAHCGVGPTGVNCGSCSLNGGGDPCGPTNLCPPNQYCSTSPNNSSCQPSLNCGTPPGTPPACWLPKDLGKCL